MLTVAKQAITNGGVIQTSVRRLAADAEVTPKAARVALSALARAGWCMIGAQDRKTVISIPEAQKMLRTRTKGTIAVPLDLKGLDLYEVDAKLCKAWPQWYRAAKATYPTMDVVLEVKKAHLWEVGQPHRKVRRTVFLASWLNRRAVDERQQHRRGT